MSTNGETQLSKNEDVTMSANGETQLSKDEDVTMSTNGETQLSNNRGAKRQSRKEAVELSSTLSIREGYMYCEDVKLAALSRELGASATPASPVFVYSKTQIQNNVAAYKEPLIQASIPHLLGYAIKANFNPQLLHVLREAGCGAVTVSGSETQLALRSGFPASDIVFNGTGKQAWELQLAITHRCLVNVDSAFDLDNIIDVARKVGGAPAKVMIRIYPNIDPDVHPFVATGGRRSKFGVDESQLPQVLDTIQQHASYVTLVGLHIHLGSTIDKVQLFSEALDVMLSLTNEVRERGFHDIQYVNLGGGLGIDYHKHMHRTCPDDRNSPKIEVLPTATDLILKVKDKLAASGLTLILEPGRSLIGNAGTFLTKVIGVKINSGKKYIIVDGSMNEIIRPALYSSYHHIELAEPPRQGQSNQNTTTATNCELSSNPPRDVYDVVGPVCESADFLGKDRMLETPHAGCLMVVMDAGAYCSSMSSNYNMRMRPAEVLVEGEKWTLIRRADSLDDVMAPYSVSSPSASR